MAPRTFDTVRYLPHENRWRDLNILAYRDTGKLTVGENSIEFNGDKETFVLTNIQRVTSESKVEISSTIGSRLNMAT